MISILWQGLIVLSAFVWLGMVFIVFVICIDLLKGKIKKWSNRERSV